MRISATQAGLATPSTWNVSCHVGCRSFWRGWMDCSRGRRVNVDPSALTWRRKTFTNGALGLAGWCRSALAFRRRVLRWRDNIVPGPGHGVGYRLACVYGVSVVPFLVATRDCRGDLRGCVRRGVGAVSGFSLRRSPGVPRNELEHSRRRFISKFVDPLALAGIAPGAIEDHRFRRGTGAGVRGAAPRHRRY